MTPEEVSQVLAQCAVFDQRSVGEADVIGWMAIIPEAITLEDATVAVLGHYRYSPDRIMPSHLLKRAWDARNRRNGIPQMELD